MMRLAEATAAMAATSVAQAAGGVVMPEELQIHMETDRIVVVQMLPQVQAEESHKAVTKRARTDRLKVCAGPITCMEKLHGIVSDRATAHGTII